MGADLRNEANWEKQCRPATNEHGSLRDALGSADDVGLPMGADCETKPIGKNKADQPRMNTDEHESLRDALGCAAGCRGAAVPMGADCETKPIEKSKADQPRMNMDEHESPGNALGSADDGGPG